MINRKIISFKNRGFQQTFMSSVITAKKKSPEIPRIKTNNHENSN
ncbi:hypothetical protein C8D70_112141 [Chryseobacterium sp. CBTAP 102]|nr:hypothetical protein C8D70_112141 [Chryseobacterium sp. CBTAP 102]SIQ64235.1 hypothetical protein SAMN05880573_10855 [Chryseobacterium sp. RU33C]